ncbi:hypothetical protein GCM10010123_21760 [Pilimelia anulata]|uniref:O-antigen ligase-related domain-containing protein n=1 Tax=Pilimelia anulata TaxID=53371 RepID=A0A8J3B2R1_9ACTN|nr:O-antigen ligase family protein [Pilimelia anulata]GGJ91592.1 hypothetical protein GCM10010123_21760 [Pilimelia anulata]
MPAPADRARTASPVLVAGLFVVVLGGRFGPAAEHARPLGLDPRALACLALLLLTVLWALGAGRYRVPLRPLGGVLALLGYLLLGGLWAHPAARLDAVGLDLAMLGVLVVAAALIVAPDPARALYWFLLLSLGAAVVFAVAAWYSGPGQQGRYAAFGGGPNVFVRIQCLGVISAIALALRDRRAWYLTPTPLLLYSAFLSGSRGGLAALTVAAAVALVVGWRLRLGHALGVLAAGLGLAVLAYVAGNAGLTRLYRRYTLAGLQGGDFSVRPELLRRAWRVLADDPLFGGGLDGFRAHAGRYIDMDYPHNLAAEVGADGGAVGLALLAGAVAWLLLHAGGRATWATWDRGGCLVAAAYLAAASMFSGGYYDTRQLWVYLTFLAALAASGGPAPAAPRPGQPPVPRAGADRREIAA